MPFLLDKWVRFQLLLTMRDIEATPLSKLIEARRIAMATGLRYVYTGNVHHPEGDTTYCSSCGRVLIERDWYEIKHYHLTANGHCPDCGTPIVGRFGKSAEHFGRQRIPVLLGHQ